MSWLFAGLLLAASIAPGAARAEINEVRISKGYGILYLPLIVMEDRKLLEKKAAEAGLGDIKVTWYLFDGGNVINDAMLAGTLDIAGTGAPGFLTLWSKAKGNSRAEVIGVSGMSTTALVLNTTNADVKSLKDFSAKDRIAMPGIKTSLAGSSYKWLPRRSSSGKLCEARSVYRRHPASRGVRGADLRQNRD
jgi:NitT/TauT family transport system substrate-binding protein